ncbi:beta strand repeat-containing protein, partial [Kiloniella sp. b19]|uniref:beta strand repeat-containing protein n=1 Tax=Kiloniella sp. GXU_MW_B19 TaxID=3141326 RepID=UPI0031DED0E8
DTASDSIQLGSNITFEDDGPTISATGAADALTVDETVLSTDATANFADNFTVDAGADGLGSVAYELAIAQNGVASGVVDTATGQAVTLHDNAGVIEGRNADGDVVFTLSVDANGTVELDQLRAVRHPNTSSNDEPISLNANVVTLTATVTDGDGDTASDSIQLGSNVTFRDDGPVANNQIDSVREDATGFGAATLQTVDEGPEQNGVTNAPAREIGRDQLFFNEAENRGEVRIEGNLAAGGDGANEFQDGFSVNLLNGETVSVGEVSGGATYRFFTQDANGNFVLQGTGSFTATSDTEVFVQVFNPAGGTYEGEIRVSSIGVESFATGNVLTGVDGDGVAAAEDQNTTDGVADNAGADGLQSINWTDETNGEIPGTYGTLVVDADGNYRYELDNSSAAVQALDPGQTVQETFTYTITDGDGDTDTATLVINVQGSDDGVTINGLEADGNDVTVDEAGLPARAGEPEGSNEAADSETAGSSFTFAAADGFATVAIAGPGGTITLNAADAGTPFTAQTLSDATGTLSITGFTLDAATGQGTVTYSYTLADNVDHPANNDFSIDYNVVVTDTDGDSAGDVLSIAVLDDVPTANDDADSVTEDGSTVATGNVISGVDAAGGDANATDGVADVEGADGIASITWTDASNGDVAGTHGTLTVGADGSYSYALNNSSAAVQGLTNGETLTETFEYTVTDGDGDTDTAVLTITINGADDVVTINGLEADGNDVTVDEAGLPARAGEPEGSNEAADSETAGSSFTFAAADGFATVAIAGPGGTITLNAADAGTPFTAQTLSDATGTLSITGFTLDAATGQGTVTYSYTLADNVDHPANNDFSVDYNVVVTDTDGDSAGDVLSVAVLDDVPTANDDADSVTEDGSTVATGNVISGVDAAGGDANATDGVADVEGADGIASITWTDASNGDVAGTHGTLTVGADGSYSYALNNSSAAVQGLDNGETLTETFEYTVTDGDGDTDTAVLTITINGVDDGVTINGLEADGNDVTVDEAGLPARAGEPEGSNEAADSETAGSSFTFAAADGFATVTIQAPGGGSITLTPANVGSNITGVVLNDATGTLSITGFALDAATGQGTVTYSYTLDDNVDHPANNDFSVDYNVVVTDTDGDSAGDVLSVAVLDDVPTANNDADSVTEDGQTVATGNVISGVDVTTNPDANATDGVADVEGADGIASITWTDASNGDVAGTHGTLTVGADGSYSYALNNSSAAVQGLTNGETLTETFEYTVTDGDGDTDTAVLTITINGADDIVTINGLEADGNDVTVDEAGLPARASEPEGSNEAADSETAGSSFTFAAADGFATVAIAGPGGTITLNAADAGTPFTAQTLSDATGTLSITGFTLDAATGQGTVTYSYTLVDNVDHPANNDFSVDYNVVVTDTDGDSAGDVLSVAVLDDVPTANDDADSVTEDGSTVATGNVISGVDAAGGDANTTDGVADVEGADGIASITWTDASNGDVAGTHGTLTVGADGSYSYALNNSSAAVQGLTNGETLTE